MVSITQLRKTAESPESIPTTRLSRRSLLDSDNFLNILFTAAFRCLSRFIVRTVLGYIIVRKSVTFFIRSTNRASNLLNLSLFFPFKPFFQILNLHQNGIKWRTVRLRIFYNISEIIAETLRIFLRERFCEFGRHILDTYNVSFLVIL